MGTPWHPVAWCLLWNTFFFFFCYRAPSLYFAVLKHQTYPAYSRQPWPFVFQSGMCRRGRKKGKKWCCPCSWTEFCVHQGSEGRGQGRGRSNERKRCLLKQNPVLEALQCLKRVSEALCYQRRWQEDKIQPEFLSAFQNSWTVLRRWF